ncbi:MAG: hypothetical protein U5N56_11175 [Candidatus Marinimicrobia bacterium]|nr:hypothetical protein [Candidatus Neomarinimicrobiota bacterium]
MDSLKGVFSAAFHPHDENIITFSGHNGEQSDIYTYHRGKDILTNLTRDTRADENPHWSPDGNYIVYARESLKSEAAA